jgi:alkylation response protein AidB-like acyl-CoA dehydrogenase
MQDGGEVVRRARALADGLLFPTALDTDVAPGVPVAQLDALAAAGLYGLAGPLAAGGLDVDPTTFNLVVEALAGGSLTTAFVWVQHHGAVRAVARGTREMREAWLAALCSGSCRAGVAFGSLRRPGPPALVARPCGDGWLLHGTAPWVTGWGSVDVVHVAARTDDGRIVWSLVDGRPGPTIAATRLRLAAVNASATVTLAFDGHMVAQDRVTLVEDFGAWRERDRSGLRPNGSLALGVATRCAELLGSSRLHAEIDASRARLDAAEVNELPEARAAATFVAMDAATELLVSRGGRAVILEDHAQRLAREAMFLMVFGQTGSIRDAQLVLNRRRSSDAGAGGVTL